MAADFTLDYDDCYGSQLVYDDYKVCFYSEIQNKHGQEDLLNVSTLRAHCNLSFPQVDHINH